MVVGTKMAKTAVVSVERTYRHPFYGKVLKSAKKYYAHDEEGSVREGDRVIIEECRPISKLKRWRLCEKAKG